MKCSAILQLPYPKLVLFKILLLLMKFKNFWLIWLCGFILILTILK